MECKHCGRNHKESHLEYYHRPDNKGWYVRLNDDNDHLTGWAGPKESKTEAIQFGLDNLLPHGGV